MHGNIIFFLLFWYAKFPVFSMVVLWLATKEQTPSNDYRCLDARRSLTTCLVPSAFLNIENILLSSCLSLPLSPWFTMSFCYLQMLQGSWTTCGFVRLWLLIGFVEPWLHIRSNGKWQDYDQLVILANRPVLMCCMVLTDIPSGPFL